VGRLGAICCTSGFQRHALSLAKPPLTKNVAQTQESLQTAFALDGLRGSHPIEVPVKNALDIDQIFDHISYLKVCGRVIKTVEKTNKGTVQGSGTIRMLSSHLGVETFLSGVSKYLKSHAYGNATTADLWAALSEEAKTDVAAFMVHPTPIKFTRLSTK